MVIAADVRQDVASLAAVVDRVGGLVRIRHIAVQLRVAVIVGEAEHGVGGEVGGLEKYPTGQKGGFAFLLHEGSLKKVEHNLALLLAT